MTLDDLLDDRQADAGAFEIGRGVQALEHAEQFTRMLQIEADALHTIRDRLTKGESDDFIQAVGILLNCTGRVVVSGIGKSGHIARKEGKPWVGQLGKDLTTEEGKAAARGIAIDVLATLHGQLGDLDRVRRIVKLLCLINSVPSFTEQHLVANGCSELLLEVFGERGRHARSAFGVAQIPLGACVEIELIAEGVETQAQCDRLVQLGCRFGQGYLFAVPQPAGSLSAVLGEPLVGSW